MKELANLGAAMCRLPARRLREYGCTGRGATGQPAERRCKRRRPAFRGRRQDRRRLRRRLLMPLVTRVSDIASRAVA